MKVPECNVCMLDVCWMYVCMSDIRCRTSIPVVGRRITPITSFLPMRTIKLLTTDTADERRRPTTVVVACVFFRIIGWVGCKKGVFDFPYSRLGADRELEVFFLFDMSIKF